MVRRASHLWKFSVIAYDLLIVAGLLIAPTATASTPPSILFRHEHHLFTLAPTNFPDWQTKKETWFYRGNPIVAPASFKVDGDVLPPLPSGVTKSTESVWNRSSIARDLNHFIGMPLRRDPGTVVIAMNGSGAISFSGVGLTGRNLNTDLAVTLTIRALTEGIGDVRLPVDEVQPTMTVTSQKLRDMGITQVVTVGESDFSNSPTNRRHNIATGLAKFNGHLIPQGSQFSFDETLGPVNDRTGYRKELVIKGQRTEPDYGGGLCQVSSTAYRGVWERGFPIKQRKNHSYAVNHYAPQGTDATVYPPSVDMKFLNDGPSALLMQTYAKNDLAYFIYYGTKDVRQTEVIGPFIWDRYEASKETKIEKTTEIPPGEKKKVGERVAGMKAMWVRLTTMPDGTRKEEPVYSSYEARPLYYLVGVDPVELPTEESPAATDPTGATSSSSTSSVGRVDPRTVPH